MENLTINIIDSIEDDEMQPSLRPAALALPMDMPLQVLDLRNIMIPSSHSRLFNGLRELSLNFRDCDDIMVLSEDELFGVFDASPQLERLSLLRVGHQVPVRNGRPLPPKCILQFPNLTSLSLENNPTVVKYTLAYMDLPAIDSLKIRSFIAWEVAYTLPDLFFPDDRLPARLFPIPQTLAVRTVGLGGRNSSMEIDIGRIGLRLDFPFGQGERGRNIVMSCIPQLVPPSVVSLELEPTDLEERGWGDFFASHTQVRSIEYEQPSWVPASGTLWDALSPAGEEATDVPCPELESISVTSSFTMIGTSLTALSNSLRNRQAAGFKLRRLKMMDHKGFLADIEGFHDEFGPFVETAESSGTGYRQKVRPVLICESRPR